MVEDSDTREFISRNRLRQAQHVHDDALAKLADQIVSLRKVVRDRLPMDEYMREAVEVAVSIPPGTGRRRQMRLVVQHLREEPDLDPLKRALTPGPGAHLAGAKAPPSPAEAQADALTQGGDEALQQWMQEHPDADRGRLRQWLRSMRGSDKAGKPTPAARKARKALVQYLHSQGS